MKSIPVLLTGILMLFIVTAAAPTGGPETVTFKVSGNCGMCKQRIEAAMMGKGVKSASWDVATDMATVIFLPEKTTLEQIKQRVAKAGYDAEGMPASADAYNRLPHCCQYRGGQGSHNH